MTERFRRRHPSLPVLGMGLLLLAAALAGACSSGAAHGPTTSGVSGSGGSATSGSGGAGSGGQTATSSGGAGSGGQNQATGGSAVGGQTPGTGGSGTAGQPEAGTSGTGGQVGSAGGGNAGSGTGGTNADSGVGEPDASAGGSAGGSTGGSSGGAAGGSSAGSAGAGGSQTFACSQVMGLMLTDQWYTAGFEKAPGIDDARWQLKWMEHAYIDEWANANSAFWGIAPMSPCAQSSNSPDRVVLVALSWTLVTLADWETNVQKDVDNIKAKYPNVKQIVLMTIIRGPGNKSCGNTTVVAENTLIPPYVDQALANVASRAQDLVKVAPKYEAAACSDFMGTGPHLTAAGDMAIARMVAATFANQ